LHELLYLDCEDRSIDKVATSMNNATWISFLIMITLQPAFGQPQNNFKRNVIGLGANYFPAYLFLRTPVIDDYGIILSYEYKLGRKIGLRTGVLYNHRIALFDASKIEDKGSFYGVNLGMTGQLFIHNRWEFFGALDVVYTSSINETNDFLPNYVTYAKKFHAGGGLGVNFSINSSWFLQTETNLTYGHYTFENVLDNKPYSTDEYWRYYFFKFFSLQLLYKF
jgi:hypothetical protein